MGHNVLYVTFMQHYFNTLQQRTHHIIDDMFNRDNIKTLDVVIINNQQEEKVKVCKTIGKVCYYSVKITPSLNHGFGHLSNPLNMFFRFKRFNQKKYDYIVSETPWGGVVGVLLKYIGRSKILIYEDMDYFPGFYTKSKIRNYIIKFLEKIVLKNSDLIITIGELLKKKRMSQTNRPIFLVENGVSFDIFNKAVEEKSQDSSPNIIYIGKIDSWAGIDIVIKAIPFIREKFKNITFSIIGEGNFENHLKKMVKELGLNDHVKFLGLKKYHELPEFLKHADIGVATFQPIDLMKYAFTLKIVEYGAAGLPVICTRIGESERYVENNDCGISIDFNHMKFAHSVLLLLDNKVEYNELSKNGIKAAKEMSWDKKLDERAEIINAFLKEKRLD